MFYFSFFERFIIDCLTSAVEKQLTAGTVWPHTNGGQVMRATPHRVGGGRSTRRIQGRHLGCTAVGPASL